MFSQNTHTIQKGFPWPPHCHLQPPVLFAPHLSSWDLGCDWSSFLHGTSPAIGSPRLRGPMCGGGLAALSQQVCAALALLSLASGLESNMRFLAPNRWAVIWDFHLIWGRPLVFHSVPESGIHCSLLKSQDRGQFGGKESLLYFGCWQPRKWAGQTPVQRLTPSPDSRGARPL